MKLTLERAVLEFLLERAALASRLVGCLDDRGDGAVVEQLGDSVDGIVHTLSELLGDPHVTAGGSRGARSCRTTVLTSDGRVVVVGPGDVVVLGGVR